MSDFQEKVNKLYEVYEELEGPAPGGAAREEDNLYALVQGIVKLLTDEEYEYMYSYMTDPRYEKIYNTTKLVSENLMNKTVFKQMQSMLGGAGTGQSGDGLGSDLGGDLSNMFGGFDFDDDGEPN